MKYKRDHRKPKSKGSRDFDQKLKRLLKEQGIQGGDAMLIVDLSRKCGKYFHYTVMISNIHGHFSANGRKHRESRRSDSSKHMPSRSHGNLLKESYHLHSKSILFHILFSFLTFQNAIRMGEGIRKIE